jgi:predicted dehydrogenase
MAIRVGLIGLNYGARVHLPIYKENPRFDLVAVCARTPGRAEAVAREHHIPNWYTDVRAFLKSDLDLVSIATPPATHAHLAAGALVSGKHAVVEVAFVGRAADARVLQHLASERQRVGAAAYVLRYIPTLKLVSDMLAQGVIGEPRLMRMDFFSSFMALPGGEYRWFWEAENGGGILAGVIAHGLDLARCWFGPIREVEASLTTLSTPPRLPPGLTAADDTGLVTLHFESGLVATFNFSAATAYRRVAIELHGSKASLLIDGFGDELSILRMDEARPQPVYVPAEYLEATRGQNGLLGGFQSFVSRLAEAVSGGPVPPDLPTFAEAWEVSRLLDAARLASTERRRVHVDEVN